MRDYVELRLRDIAKMLAKSLPVEGQEFTTKVEEYLSVIKAMPRAQKVALKIAYQFGRKVPREEREDLFQDIALTLLKANTGEEKLAYAIARCDWQDWWRKYKIRQHTSLESVTEDNEGNPVTLGELLVGEVEFENKMNGKLDAKHIWGLLPVDIKPLVNKRLIGKALTATERKRMNRFVHSQGAQLLLA